jgi:hypothetical protein
MDAMQALFEFIGFMMGQFTPRFAQEVHQIKLMPIFTDIIRVSLCRLVSLITLFIYCPVGLAGNCAPKTLSELLHSIMKNREIKHLDDPLLKEIDDLMKPLTRSQKNRFLKTLKNIKFFHDARISPEGGFVTPFPLRLKLNELVRNHPMGRILLRHELQHVKQVVSMRLIKRTVLLEKEAEAFGAEYDYIHNLYTRADLPKLKREYPDFFPGTDAADWKKINSAQLLLQDGDFINNSKLTEKLEKDLELRAAFERAIEARLNRHFLSEVTEITTMSRDEFIKLQLQKHSSYKLLDNAIKQAEDLLIKLTIVGLGIAASEYIYEHLLK